MKNGDFPWQNVAVHQRVTVVPLKMPSNMQQYAESTILEWRKLPGMNFQAIADFLDQKKGGQKSPCSIHKQSLWQLDQVTSYHWEFQDPKLEVC